jgi:hypothetical protein
MVTELPVPHTGSDTTSIQNKKEPFKDIDDFLSPVNSAQADDLIILTTGSYDLSSNKDTKFSSRKGAATNRIIVRAQHVDRVTLRGSAFLHRGIDS